MLSAKERGYLWRKECGVSEANWHMFVKHTTPCGVRPFRIGISRPRVHGGYAIMTNRPIVTPTIDVVEVYQCVR